MYHFHRNCCQRVVILLCGLILALSCVFALAQGTSKQQKRIDELTNFDDIFGAIGKLQIVPIVQLKSAAGQEAFEKGEYTIAEQHWLEGLQASKEAGSNEGVAQFKGNLGSIYFRLGQYDKAVEHYEGALQLMRNISMPSAPTMVTNAEAGMIVNIGNIYMARGHYSEALDYFKQALAYSKKNNDTEEAGSSNPNEMLFSILDNLSFDPGADTNNPLPQKQISDQLDNLLGNLMNCEGCGGGQEVEMAALSGIGSIYGKLNQYDNALYYYGKAMTISRKANFQSGMAMTHTNTGIIHFLKNDYDKALKQLQHAVEISKANDYQKELSVALTAIGTTYREKKQYKNALENLNNALILVRGMGDLASEVDILNETGLVYSQYGEFDEALANFRQAKNLLESLDRPNLQWTTLRNIASLEVKKANYAAARASYFDALKVFEKTRALVREKENSVSLQSKNIHIYDELIDLLYTLHNQSPNKGYGREALEVFERKQARQLLEEIGRSSARRFSGVPEEVVRREQSLDEEIAEKQELISQTRIRIGSDSAHIDQEKTLAKQVQTIKAERKRLQAKIRQNYPAYYALKHPSPVTVKEIQNNTLYSDELILTYNVTENETFLWLMGQASLEFISLPIGKEKLQADVDSILSSMGVNNTRGVQMLSEEGRNNLDKEIHLLYNLLFPEKIRNIVAVKDIIYVVPTESLYDLPFELLITNIDDSNQTWQYLIEKQAIAYISSMSMLNTLRDAEQQPKTDAHSPFLAFANPTYASNTENQISDESPSQENLSRQILGGTFRELSETEDEAKGIAEILQLPKDSETLYLQERASRSNLLKLNMNKRLEDYQYVLFATHGVLPGEVNELEQPALVLSHPEDDGSEGFLTMSDVFELSFNADLISLSACNTGQGSDVRGEGVMGLTRAFMYAGTPAVAVTLWAVESLSAKELSVEFFKHLNDTPHAAKALQAAKISMLRGEQYRDPRYWAPLVLFGHSHNISL